MTLKALLLLLGTIFAFTTAEAKTPRSSEVSAVIKEVIPERQAIRVEFTDDVGKRELELKWTRLSSAYENGEEMSFKHLYPGLKIRLRYRSPLFGEPVIRQIVFIEKILGSFWKGNDSFSATRGRQCLVRSS